ncbi:MAG: sigma-54-dependent Fis family transcriptional regulator [Gammaproteobacteria bacterium RBG_16_51_14]|nr:MAG: sigma-54-dependent Fis family transcriptional regulator [Gammaproteobacteria bacterium RBG_16_51_14]
MFASDHKPALLLVDDDPLIVEALSLILEDEFHVYTADSERQVKALLQRLEIIPSLALVDLGLPPFPHAPDEGFKVIEELPVYNPDIKILVLSGQDEKTNIQHALTLGAVDFITKPCDIPLLKARLRHQLMMLQAELAQKKDATRDESLLGESMAINTLHALTRQFADTPYPVLVEGESGCGKELIAHYLHDYSSRAAAPFLSINCAAFSAELLEAQLFGHAKGSFTGASVAKAGFFEEAGEGSLLLDEIGELPLGLQAKLLRVLENGEYYRLGETHARVSFARIIAATNRDLREEVRTGRFRQDLYHRLNVLTLHVPPLRERDRDCLLLLDHFRKIYVTGGTPFTLDKEAEGCLLAYAFPGNIRELKNIVIRLNAKYPGKLIGIDALQAEMERDYKSAGIDAGQSVDNTARQELLQRGFHLDEVLEKWEKRYINAALELCNGNLSKAARMLGINRTTLYSRLQRMTTSVPE